VSVKTPSRGTIEAGHTHASALEAPPASWVTIPFGHGTHSCREALSVWKLLAGHATQTPNVGSKPSPGEHPQAPTMSLSLEFLFGGGIVSVSTAGCQSGCHLSPGAQRQSAAEVEPVAVPVSPVPRPPLQMVQPSMDTEGWY
jgi:hypothetical protein